MIRLAAVAGSGDENCMISLCQIAIGLEVSSLHRFEFKRQVDFLNVGSPSGAYLLEQQARVSRLYRISPSLSLTKEGSYGRGAFFLGLLANGEPVIGNVEAQHGSLVEVKQVLTTEPLFVAPPWRYAITFEGVSASVKQVAKSADLFSWSELKTARLEGFTQAAELEPKNNCATFVGYYPISSSIPVISRLFLSEANSLRFESMPLKNLPTGFLCKGIARLSRSFTLVAGTVRNGGQWSDQKVVVLAVNSRTGAATKIWESSNSDLTGGSLMSLTEGLFIVATRKNSIEVLRIRSKT